MEDNKLIFDILKSACSDEAQQYADNILMRLKRGEITHERMGSSLNIQDIGKVLNVDYLANRFFGGSHLQLQNAICPNESIGDIEQTSEARNCLKNALEILAIELQDLSDMM